MNTKNFIEIKKGYSTDKKFKAELPDGEVFIKQMPKEDYVEQMRLFGLCKIWEEMGVPTSAMQGVIVDDDGTFVISNWIDGKDLKGLDLKDNTWHTLGLFAGQYLSLIHSVPVPPHTPDWKNSYLKKVKNRLTKYASSNLKIEGDEILFNYMKDNLFLLDGRPQCFLHGDYHVGNMMLKNDHTLSIIDFSKYKYGDPYKEFVKMVWNPQRFNEGLLKGYFNGKAPDNFYPLLKFYMADHAIGSVLWAQDKDEKQKKLMLKLAKNTAAMIKA